MICADHAFKILDGIYPIDQVVEIEVLEITARRLRSGERLSSAAPLMSRCWRRSGTRSLRRTILVTRLERARLLLPELSKAFDMFSTDEPPEPDRLEVAYWASALAAGLADTPIPADAPKRLAALALRALAFVDEMDFRFLYDRQRKIFAIGYRLADAEGPGRLDASYYDLLASEARLASFVAIAKGDVPAATGSTSGGC